ncbi:hypothetical protein L484_013336 [Morus notabilis]|uniref:Uncharacterized protein n=1 Tax=Morus notabilis TaxID=981085 RepID=W9SM34_9ROSA|nr:hypothetical protein L484_013336 [Morus notabilis]
MVSSITREHASVRLREEREWEKINGEESVLIDGGRHRPTAGGSCQHGRRIVLRFGYSPICFEIVTIECRRRSHLRQCGEIAQWDEDRAAVGESCSRGSGVTFVVGGGAKCVIAGGEASSRVAGSYGEVQ